MSERSASTLTMCDPRPPPDATLHGPIVGSAGSPSGWPGLSFVLTLGGIALAGTSGLQDVTVIVTLAVAGFGYALIGARIVLTQPRNPVGWLLIGSGLSWALTLFVTEYSTFSFAPAGGSPPGATLAAALGGWTWMPGAAMFMVYIPLLFPDGHFSSRRWRLFAGLVAVAVALDIGLHLVAAWIHIGDLPYLTGGYTAASEPGGIGALADIADGWPVLSLIAVASVFLRLRRSRGVQRLQIRWYAWAIALAAIAILAENIVLKTYGGPLSVFAITIIPVSIGVAILRYRLYDLDRLVSRTISYGLVTGTLVAAYGGLILLLGGPLGSFANGDTLSVALATLGVAALFQPVRRRVQRTVDRRFDRARYDGERTAAAFSARMRDAHDLNGLALDLDRTVRRAMAPSAVDVWVRNVTKQQGRDIP